MPSINTKKTEIRLEIEGGGQTEKKQIKNRTPDESQQANRKKTGDPKNTNRNENTNRRKTEKRNMTSRNRPPQTEKIQ